MQTCTKCQAKKPEDEFPRNSKAKGRNYAGYWCKSCNRQHYLDNIDRHKMQTRTNNIRKRYGLTLDAYAALVAKGCAICGTKAEGRIVVDHCHVSGKVRDALCDGCNLMLGASRDDPETLRAAASYLESHAEA